MDVPWHPFKEEPWEKEDGFMELRRRHDCGTLAMDKQLAIQVPKKSAGLNKIQQMHYWIVAFLTALVIDVGNVIEVVFWDKATNTCLLNNTHRTIELRKQLELVYDQKLFVRVTFVGSESSPNNAMDVDAIERMRKNFLNNAFVNCCFFTTYAEVLGSAIKKGAEWFTFVNPAIGTPIFPIDNFSCNASSSGYDSQTIDTFSPEHSNNSSPIPQANGRRNGRITQKQRKEMAREAQEREKATKLNAVEAEIPCPPDHEIKSVPSKFYSFGFSSIGNSWIHGLYVGMQKKTETVKVEPKKAERIPRVGALKRGRRAGNNHRKRSPKPVMPPRVKEPIVIDEEGFQLVTGKKAAKLPPSPPPKVEKPKRVRVKKAKKNRIMGPTKAMILHAMKPEKNEETVIEDVEDEEEEEEIVEVPEVIEVPVVEPVQKKVIKSPKKTPKPVKKEDGDKLVEIYGKLNAERDEKQKKKDAEWQIVILVMFALLVSAIIVLGSTILQKQPVLVEPTIQHVLSEELVCINAAKMVLLSPNKCY